MSSGSGWNGSRGAAAPHEAQEPTGLLCFDRLDLRKFHPHSRRTDTPAGWAGLLRSLQRGVDITIDGGAPIHVSTAEGAQLRVPLAGRHRVTIRRDGGEVHERSFHFRFGRHTQLCLYYRPMYDGWELPGLELAHGLGKCRRCALEAPTDDP
jgi:hypothetical protein